MESLDLLTAEIISGTRIEPLLHSGSTYTRLTSHQLHYLRLKLLLMAPVNVNSIPTVEETNNTPSTCDDGNYGYDDRVLRHAGSKSRPAELSSQSNMVGPLGTREDGAATIVAETSLATGKHRRSLMTAIQEGHYQEEHPFRKIHGTPHRCFAISSFFARTSEKNKAVQGQLLNPPFSLDRYSQTSLISSGKASHPMLAAPTTALHPSTESLGNVDISYSITPPPIVFLCVDCKFACW